MLSWTVLESLYRQQEYCFFHRMEWKLWKDEEASEALHLSEVGPEQSNLFNDHLYYAKFRFNYQHSRSTHRYKTYIFIVLKESMRTYQKRTVCENIESTQMIRDDNFPVDQKRNNKIFIAV